jgi:plasmid replication initiation protein
VHFLPQKGAVTMADEAVANTPETLGVTPRYVLQHNALSRSIQNLSATAKKLTAMAMSLLPADLSSRTASFSIPEFCHALGIKHGGNQYALIKAAASECMNAKISIEQATAKGKKNWKGYTWFTYSEVDEASGVCTMTFSEDLAGVLLELKRVYTQINLQDLGKLQSKYGLRIFEMAKSYESLEGKDGNPGGSWYFERTIPEFRELFAVPEGAYPETKHFRQFVIEEPVKEINAAGIGVALKTEGIKQGRNLKALRLTCQQAPRTAAPKRGKRKTVPPPELPDPNPKRAGEHTQKELEHLKERYPDEFADLYTAELAKPSWLPVDSEVRKQAAQGAATTRLHKKYGIVK